MHHTTSSSCGWGDHCNHCNHSSKHNSNHLSVNQWLRSAIPDSQQPTSPIGFLFWNFRHRLVRYYWYWHQSWKHKYGLDWFRNVSDMFGPRPTKSSTTNPHNSVASRYLPRLIRLIGLEVTGAEPTDRRWRREPKLPRSSWKASVMLPWCYLDCKEKQKPKPQNAEW